MELFAADGHDAGGCERVTGKSGMRPIQPGAPGMQDFHPSPPDRKGAGVESAGTKSTERAHRKIPVSQYGVLAGLRVQLNNGLLAALGTIEKTDIWASAKPLHDILFHEYAGPAPAGWRTDTKLTLAIGFAVHGVSANTYPRFSPMCSDCCGTRRRIDRSPPSQDARIPPVGTSAVKCLDDRHPVGVSALHKRFDTPSCWPISPAPATSG